MLLRFQSRNGQFRLTAEDNTEFTSLLAGILEKLPSDTDPASIMLSNKPQGGDARKLSALKGVQLSQVGIKYDYRLDLA
jgi:nuclear protein localization family protein 4